MNDEFKLDVIVGVEGVQEMRQLTRDEQDLQAATEAAGKAADRSSRQMQSRDGAASRLRRRLVELHRAEERHQQSVTEGAAIDRRAERESQRRRNQIDRISRALAQQTRAEQLAQQSIRGHIDGIMGAGDAADKSAKSHGKLNDVLSMMPGSFAGIATGAGAVAVVYQGILDSIQAVNDAMRENSELAKQQARERLDMAMLQGFDSDTQPMIDRLSAFSGRTSGEIATGVTVIGSMFAKQSEEFKAGVLGEAAAMAQVTSMRYEDIAKVIGLISLDNQDPKKSANIALEGIKQAGEADPERFMRNIQQSMSVAKDVGDMTEGEAVGLAAGTTALGLEGNIAITGLRRIISTLKAPATPDQQEIFKRLDLDVNDLEASARKISEARQSGAMSDLDLVKMFGQETLPTASAFFQPEKLESTFEAIRLVRAAEQYEGRKASDIRSGIDESRTQQLTLLSDQIVRRTENKRARDVGSLEKTTVRAAIEERLTELELEGRISPAEKNSKLWAFDMALGAGESVESAARLASIAEPLWQSLLKNFGTPNRGHIVNLVDVVRGMADAQPDTDASALLNDVVDIAGEQSARSRPASASPQVTAPTQSAGGVTNITNIAEQNNYGTDPYTDIRNPEEAD